MDEDLAAVLAQLRAVAQQRIQGPYNAVQVDRIGQALCNQATTTIRAVMSEWNSANSRWHMPPEVLAACCGFLRFRDRLRVSHVCRSWRSAAVQFPEIWSDIVLTDGMKSPQDILRVVLDRTGQHGLAISYEHTVPHPYVPGMSEPVFYHSQSLAIARVLAPHMHHLRTLVWCGALEAPCFLLPAPLLKELHCMAISRIPQGFLGSSCAVLETLSVYQVCLPPGCLSLSTVVTLSADLPREGPDAENLPRLFDIFPRLQHLTLRGYMRSHADVLPTGPAPRTLRQLELVGWDISGRAIDVFVRWRTDALKDALIKLFDLPPSVDPSSFLEGTVAMAIENARSDPDVAIVTTTASGSKTVLKVSLFEGDEQGDLGSRIAQFLRRGSDGLRQLRRLTLSLHVLLRVPATLLSLPALVELYVWIYCPAPNGIPVLPLVEKDAFAFLTLQPAIELVGLDFVNAPASPEGLEEFLSAIVNDYPSIDPGAKRPRVALRGLPDAHLAACGLLDPDRGILDAASVFARVDSA